MHPTDQAIREYTGRLREIRAAQARGEDVTEMDRELKAFMLGNGLGEEAPVGPVSSSPATDNNDVLTAAIGMAQEAGDTATVARLKALADKPHELAAVLGQLQGAPAK